MLRTQSGRVADIRICHRKVSGSEEPAITWSKGRRGFLLGLPKGDMPPLTEMESLFKGKILECFEGSAPPTPLAQRPAPSDDWADLGVDIATVKPTIADEPTKPSSQGDRRQVDRLPSVEILARPDELLLKPPHHLTVTNMDSLGIEIQCSHSPTLRLLADYLKKWCRTNHQDSRNVSLPGPPFLEPCLEDY